MQQAIDELKAIPGVVGACLFSPQEGLLASNLPGLFKPEKLAAVGKQLAKLLAAGRMSFSDINDLSLHYEESVVISRELRKGLLIFALCDPSFNHNLLTMSLNLMQEEVRDQPDSLLLAVASAGGSAKAEIAADLQPVLDELKACLAKVLGPMAGFIFEEIQQEWARQGASAARLNELITLLNREIGDPEKIATYRALTASLLHA